ncbi:MAG: HlyD family type I secretion periplasmic adaptor subunit [Cohaesibacter sp.]|nr:HlyD family type I secretion periplasmic adaptor subunit [Cohaesibacter sp.]
MITDKLHNDFRRATSMSSIKIFGILIILFFFVGFGFWATTAPMSGAVIASGWITKEGESQSIIHETGGVISQIRAKEGQQVEKGQILVQIEDADKQAEKKRLETRLASLIVRQSRLMAEEAGEDFKGALGNESRFKQLDATDLATFLNDQLKEYQARQDLLSKEKSILERQKEVLRQEQIGIDLELKSIAEWRNILKNQVSMRQTLLKKGSISKVAVQETKMELAEVSADFQKLQSQYDLIPHRISELDARLGRLVDAFTQDVAHELAEIRTEKLTLEKQLAAADKAVSRINLVSPVSGKINKLHVNTIGSAVAAFQPIVDIVPEDRPIVMEVEVKPSDIEQVQVGQNAKVTLSAFDPSKVPPIVAIVQFVSPDRRIHNQTQIPYFVARLEMKPEPTRTLPQIMPGMPIEAYLETEKRTFLQMLFDPLTKSMRRAFRS